MSSRPLLAAPAPRRAPVPTTTAPTPITPTSTSTASGSRVLAVPSGDADDLVRRALDIGRRTALGVLAGDASTADDIAQEVAIQALRRAHQLRDPEALDGWLHRTAVRAALRTIRRGHRRRAVEHDHAAIAAPVVPLEERDRLDDLGRLLEGLPERQRAALTLRYAHDLDDARIAAALGCRVGTVRALLSRGRQTLRDRMDADPTTTETPHA